MEDNKLNASASPVAMQQETPEPEATLTPGHIADFERAVAAHADKAAGE